MLSILGDKIKNLRHLKRISQKDLAEMLGVTRQTIASWEDGRTIPDLMMAAKLVDVLNVTLEDLVSAEKSPETCTLGPNEKRFLGTVTIGKDCIVKLPKEFLREMGVFPGDQMLMLADTERGVEFLPMDTLWKNSLEKYWVKSTFEY